MMKIENPEILKSFESFRQAEEIGFTLGVHFLSSQKCKNTNWFLLSIDFDIFEFLVW